MNPYILRVLSERSFLFLWIGEIFTQVSTHLFNFFLILIVFKLTESNTAVSIAVLSFTVPAILFGTVAGAYVDRWDKKKVLVITTVLRALLLILLAFFLDNLYMIYFISFVFNVLVQFFIPAESPMIPLLVREKYLLGANALFGLAIFGSMLVAYVLSGPLLLLLEPFYMALLLGFMLLLAVFFIGLIKPVHHKPKTEKKEDQDLNIFRDIKNTIQLMSKTSAVFRSLFLLALSQILVLTLATVAPGYASQVLNVSVEEFPVVFIAPAALGMVAGALIIASFLRKRNKERMITTGVFLSGIAMLLLPFGSRFANRDFVQLLNNYIPDITAFHITFFLAFILGLANSLVFVPANTILQEKTSEEFRGKIYGFLSTAIGLLSLLPIILVGGFADLIGVGAVIVGIGISLIVLGFVLMFVT
jgi:MFS family permease